VNAHYWASNYRDFLEFFFSQAFIEPHSTKQIEDCVGYGLDKTPEVLIATMRTQGVPAERARELCDRVRCAVSVIHGSHDRCVPTARGAALAEILGTPLINIEGGGHCTHARDPVRINLLIREFVDRLR
jgi:pimeloyl-ACP methyl ester carboxylesterase